jgi:hypothetical protein
VEIKSGANTGKHFSPDSFRLSNVFLFFTSKREFSKNLFLFCRGDLIKRRGDDRVMSTHSERARARAKFKILKKDKKGGWWWWWLG